MLIERNEDNNIVITISSSVDSFALQRVLDYIKYMEAVSNSKATQKDADKLAEMANESWWKKYNKRSRK